MSSLADLPEIVGFFSYSRDDDEAFQGTLSALRDGIQRELAAQLGRSKRTFRLWQDQAAIAPGKFWETEIKKAVGESIFFIPIVTPRAVNSKYCKFEFESFLAREKTLGRDDLVFPILYIPVALLEDESKWRNDVVLSTIGARQYVDWRPLRHLDVQTTTVREKVEGFCRQIVEALNQPWMSPEERRMEEIKARQQAEKEQKARRLQAEAKRAEEEEGRKEAEEEARWRTEESESKALEAEAQCEPPSAQPSPQLPGPRSERQLEHVSSEQPKAATVSLPWRIIAGSAITLGVIAIATVWRFGPPVTPQLAPPVTSEPTSPLTPQLAPPVAPRSAPRVTPEPTPPVTPLDASAMYSQGESSYRTQDYAKALEWYEKAAAEDNADAMFKLGLLYHNGQGVAQNNAKAIEWYEKAADKGNTDAMVNLGMHYANGLGVARNYAKAREWYEKAAAKDNAIAMVNLAVLYHNGQGVARNYAKARELLNRAADKGNSNAKGLLKQLPFR